jgi:DNA-binding NarL/FixJ family response regulator
MIADDHDLLREGIKHVLEKYPDIQIVSEVTNGNDLLSKIKNVKIDLLLLDVSMPGPGFITIMQKLRKNYPDINVLVLSVHPEEHYAIRALKAGAKGYMEKNLSHEELYTAIHHIHKGRQYITSSLHAQFIIDKNERIDLPIHERLSNRELQILLLIGSGKSVTEISKELFLSPKTVSTYRQRILEKTGFKNNAELMRYSMINELV